MLGMIYLFLAVMLGYEGSKILTEKNNHAGYAANRIWLILPASFGVGMLVLTWIVYIVSWFASVVGGSGMTGSRIRKDSGRKLLCLLFCWRLLHI